MQHTPDTGSGIDATAWLLLLPLLAGVLAYLSGVVAVGHKGRCWPAGRTGCWIAGSVLAAAAVCGPVAAAEHHDFTIHTVGHLLLGMAATLLLVLGAPVTLALQALPVARSRAVSHILGSRPLRFLAHPLTALVLDGGGLWLLYTTALYEAIGKNRWLDVVVHAHVLAAGYLFTAAVIGVDPMPHRPSRLVRGGVLIAFLAGHAILAKYLYGHPPTGVSPAAAALGAEVMYYGGDLIDLVVITIFCRQWYTATDPRRARARSARV